MADLHATIEPISGMLRVWTEKHDDSVHNSGVPYLLSATVRWLDPHSLEIMGLSIPSKDDDTPSMTPSIWRAIREECIKNWNIKKVLYIRYRNKEKIEKWIYFRS